MKNTKIGFIGCGNLATALITGIASRAPQMASDITVSDRFPDKAYLLKEKYPIGIAADNQSCAQEADLLFLTVKPDQYASVIEGIRDCVSPSAIIISVGAGVSLSFVEGAFRPGTKIIRCMPNTPALVAEGMIAICPNSRIAQEDLALAESVLGLCAKVEQITEDLFDVVTGVSGSGPAYVYLFIDAMAKAAQKDGMERSQAVAFAAQTALGASKMVLESGIDPETLTEQVCSPGGTTIEAVTILREKGLTELVGEAQHACVEKSKKMHR